MLRTFNYAEKNASVLYLGLQTRLLGKMKAAKLLMPRCTIKPQEQLHIEYSKPQGLYTGKRRSFGASTLSVTSALCIQLHTNNINFIVQVTALD